MEDTYTLTLTAAELDTLISACGDSEETTESKIKDSFDDYTEEDLAGLAEHLEVLAALSQRLIGLMFPHIAQGHGKN